MGANDSMFAEHDATIMERIFGIDTFMARGVCDCGWVGPWRNSLWTTWRSWRDARRHMRRSRKANHS